MNAPMPSLHFYASDVDALIATAEDRGIHPDETGVVMRVMRAMMAENDRLRQELHEAQTYRANAEAEELTDLRSDLARAMDRIADLEIRLFDARRKIK